MEYFEVEGPVKLKGDFYPKGAKNAAFPIISASLLASEPVILENVPEIKDIKFFIEILRDLGASVERLEPNKYKIDPRGIDKFEISEELGKQIRGSLLFAGALLSKYGKAKLPRPGGDIIGKRRIDTHFYGFKKLGAEYHINNHFYIEAENLKGAYIYLDEASVTGTENIINAAVLAEGTTTIYNAACEPHVQDQCNFLNSLGASIEGIGTNRLIIHGVKKLNGGTYRIIPDQLEVCSIIGLAAISNSDIRIKNINEKYYHIVKHMFNKIGIEFFFEDEDIIVPSSQSLTIDIDDGNLIPTIYSQPWPSFPSDLTSIAVACATQAKGSILVHEKMFESRMFFIDKLNSLGAQIVLCDPHRVVVNGPTRLVSGEVTSPDIRAGMAMLIATLVADGKSRIFNIHQIDRGYERIDERLNELGAKIKRVVI